MAIDLSKLSQSDLLQAVNATPLGVVLTRHQLRRQLDAGGFRFSDGAHIHMVRYARWLEGELAKPRPAKIDYVESRRRKAARERAGTKAAQDIYPIPEIVDYARRQACGESFKLFCNTYFPRFFTRPWSEDHLRVIAKIERAVREGGLFALAMPRGSGKTAISRCAALWAILYGYRPYVCLIAGSQANAQELLRPIRTLFLGEDLLLADFPEAVYPLRRLENSSKRQGQQHIAGQLTQVHWGLDRLVFPTVDGDHLPLALRQDGYEASPSSGSVITTTSLDSNLRGQQHTRAGDNSIIRPSLVLLDDPQTRESARSADQTRKRLDLLHGDVMGLAGPGETISALLTGTVMYEDDLVDTLLDKEKSSEWDSERTKLVYSWPTKQDLWDRYAEVKRTRGRDAATAFYADHRDEMDAGAVVAWADRYDPKVGEISAIQYAVNLKLKMGAEGFQAECQNEPVLAQMADNVLTVDQVLEKVNGLARGEVPPAATKLTAFADVHDRVLFYIVCAWQDDFVGHVVDYGTFPDQRRSYFTLADASKTLGQEFGTKGVDGAIHAGLEQLVSQLLAREFKRGTGLMKIDRLLVDSGYKPGIVADVKRRVGGSGVMLSKGIGIRASRRPIAAYVKKPGETIGHYWYIPNVRHTAQFPFVLIDVNYWKSFVHAGMATALADRGSISMFGTAKTDHTLFAEHIARSEHWVEVTGPYSTVREWSTLPGKPDNHFLDGLVGAAAAASMIGCRTPSESAGRGRAMVAPGKQRLRNLADIGRP